MDKNNIDHSKPTLILTGIWDPLIPRYSLIIDYAMKYCDENGYNLVTVLLDENVHKESPEFDSPGIRKWYLSNKSMGIVVEFPIDNKKINIQDLVQTFGPIFNIKEIWLHEAQINNSEPDREQNIMGQEFIVRTIRVDEAVKKIQENVKEQLLTGNIYDATTLTGHSPIWQKDNNKYLVVNWSTGFYEYIPTTFISPLALGKKGMLGIIEVYKNKNNQTVFDWPDSQIDMISIIRKIS